MNPVLVALLVVAAVGLVLCVAAMISAARGFARADRADAQPDFTPLDEWAATAALDPRDGADLPAGDDGPCEADGWVLDFYQYLDKERSK